MRRTGALVAVTILLSAVLASTSRSDAIITPPPPDSAVDAEPASRPQRTTAPISHEASQIAQPPDLAAPTAAQGEGQGAALSAPIEAPLASGAVASRRPALTAVLDPAGGATLVASGSAVAGSGPTHRYSVEVEPALGLDVELVRAIVESALHDDQRSWARTRTLQRVDDPQAARIRVVIASPETVDAICATVGLNTAGIFSCWTGRIAALNAWRWEVGAAGFPDVASYRTYLINHEVGHALGYGHISCPGAGSIAPVMMQQSKGLAGCTANGWPYP
jgi:hypothetical protein